MTIALRAAGTHTAATAAVTAINPSTPAGILTGDISILTVQIKAATVGVAPTITTPDGWTLIGTVTNNGLLGSANDTGSNTVGLYYKVSATASTATGNIGNTGANSMGAVINTYSTTAAGWDVTQTTTGSDTASGANGSLTGAAGLDVAPGDWVLVGAGCSGDIGTASAQAIAGMAGATLGTVANRTNAAVTTGQDSKTLVSDVKVTAASSTSAPTFTYTNASSTTSHAQWVRLREVGASTLANTGAGGTHGVTVTPANSGGASGDAWGLVTLGSTSTITYDNTLGERLGYKFNVVATSSATHEEWAVSTSTLSLVFYLQMPAVPTTEIPFLLNVYDGGGTARAFGVIVQGTSKLRLCSATDTLGIFTAAAALSADTLYRVEVAAIKGTTTSNGTLKFAYFLGDSTTPIETAYDSGATTNTGIDNFCQIRFGKAVNGTFASAYYMGAFRADATQAVLLGPPATNTTVTAVSLPSSTATTLAGTVNVTANPTIVGASLPSSTVTALAGAVSATANATVDGVSVPGSTVTALAGAVDLSQPATVVGASVPSASVAGLPGTVDVTANPTVVGASLPSATVTALAGSVAADALAVGASVPATAAAALAGTVDVTANPTIAGPTPSSTVTAPAGTVAAAQNVTLDGTLPTVTVAAPAGSVAVTANPTVAGPVATTTVTAAPGSVITGGSVAVGGPVIVANTTAPAGLVDVTANPTIAGPVASSTTSALAGDVTATSGVTVIGSAASSTITGLAGAVEAISNVTIAGLVAQANVQALAGLVTLAAAGDVAVDGPVILITITAPPGAIVIDIHDITVSVQMGPAPWVASIARETWRADMYSWTWTATIAPLEAPVYDTDRAQYTPVITLTAADTTVDLVDATLLMRINAGAWVAPDWVDVAGNVARVKLLCGTDAGAYTVAAGRLPVWLRVADTPEDFDILAGNLRVKAGPVVVV